MYKIRHLMGLMLMSTFSLRARMYSMGTTDHVFTNYDEVQNGIINSCRIVIITNIYKSL